MFEPFVSIIIPVYNGENYLKDAIDSAIRQNYKNKEIIVVNDGSNDATEEIALSYENKIRYYYKENGGVSSALNLGIREMKGEFFSWLSHDDLYAEDKIENQVKALSGKQHQNCMVVCYENQINKDGVEIKPYSAPFKKDNYIYNWEQGLIQVIKCGSFGGCSLLIPREALVKCGYFDEKLRYCQDFYMWIKLFLNKLSIIQSPNKSVSGRVHNQQVTQTRKDLFFHDLAYLTNILYSDLYKVSNKEINYVFLFAKYCAKYNDKNSENIILNNAMNDKSLNRIQIFAIKLLGIYGCIRPVIRRLYFRFVIKVNTR